jgi:hypothetical protein
MSLIVAPGNILMLTFSPIDRLSLGGLIIFIMEYPSGEAEGIWLVML